MKAKRITVAVIPRDDAIDVWATRITAALQKTVEGIFETGRLLFDARNKLEHGKWKRLFDDRRVPMTVQTARRFIEIYKRREVLLANRTHVFHLPPSWGTLYQLARLPDDTLAWAQNNGRITSDLERKQINQLRVEYEGAPLPSSSRKITARSVPPYVADDAARTPAGRVYFRVTLLLEDELESLAPAEQQEVIDLLEQALADMKRARLEVVQ